MWWLSSLCVSNHIVPPQYCRLWTTLLSLWKPPIEWLGSPFLCILLIWVGPTGGTVLISLSYHICNVMGTGFWGQTLYQTPLYLLYLFNLLEGDIYLHVSYKIKSKTWVYSSKCLWCVESFTSYNFVVADPVHIGHLNLWQTIIRASSLWKTMWGWCNASASSERILRPLHSHQFANFTDSSLAHLPLI